MHHIKDNGKQALLFMIVVGRVPPSYFQNLVQE